MSVEPGNRMLQQRAAVVANLRKDGKMTCPSTIGEELKANPFLRADDPDLQARWGHPGNAVATFAAMRAAKDSF